LSSVILVLGGARSGKSSLAEKLARQMSDHVFYVATAAAHDEEMAERIRQHRARRPATWKTLEETHRLPELLMELPANSVVLIDCLTLWVSNLLLDQTMPRDGAGESEKELYIVAEAGRLLEAARKRGHRVVMVSNEVGNGLVPDKELGRKYRDIIGRVNQLVAGEAQKVYLVIAGIPLDLKVLAANLELEESL